jgi:pimeloyl-ACP methyl ester carboxylesterase
MPTVRVGELTIGYDIRGESESDNPEDHLPPILLIAGFGMTRHMWASELCDLLAARGYPVVRMDNRDTGDSTRMDSLGVPNVPALFTRAMLNLPVKAPYHLEDMAKDAVGLMTALGFPRFHVVGASMGGMIAQIIAMDHPARAASLASIMSTPGGRLNSLGNPAALASIMKPSPVDPAAQRDHLVEVFRTLSGGGTPFEEERLRRLAELHVATGPIPAGSARQFAAILENVNRRWKRMRTICAPTVVIHGALDPLIPRRAADATAKAIAGANLVIVPNMGHDLPTGAYNMVIDAIVSNAQRASKSAVA